MVNLPMINRARIYNGEKAISSKNGVRKTEQLHLKESHHIQK